MEKTFWFKGDECKVTSDPYTLYGGRFVDAVIIESNKTITVSVDTPRRHGIDI